MPRHAFRLLAPFSLAALGLLGTACAVYPPPPPPGYGPPAVALAAPPLMVWVPELGLYVAYRTPYRIFFYGGSYYYYVQGAWYAGPGYNGPWNRVAAAQLPPPLLRYRDENWNRYQVEAEQRYQQGGFDPQHQPFTGAPGRGGRGRR
ncbi:MAG: hypothetical protein ACOY5C_00340 [Pseudomonadota bacterium]|uniref:hypothetical protein n=1 Tax=Thermithiobacillus tepidarius TaxID=929 RepID=UPI000420B5AB|nr:hypothetical protein [Thermithiobacillus tepidarius]